MFAVIQCVILLSLLDRPRLKKRRHLNSTMICWLELKAKANYYCTREMILNALKRNHWRKYYKHHFRSVTFVFFFFFSVLDDYRFIIVLKEEQKKNTTKKCTSIGRCVDFLNWVLIIIFDWIISSKFITFAFQIIA